MSASPITDRAEADFAEQWRNLYGNPLPVVHRDKMRELEALCGKLAGALRDLHETARSSSWAHITNATEDDPCTCKGCSLKKAKAALAEFDRLKEPKATT